MKNVQKIITAVLTACSLIFSLSGSAQTIIKSNPIGSSKSIFPFQNDRGDLIVIEPTMTSTTISQVLNNSLQLIIEVPRRVDLSTVLFSSQYMYFATSEETYRIDLDNPLPKIILPYKVRPLLTRDNKLVIVRETDGSKLLSIFNVETGVLDDIISTTVTTLDNRFVLSSGIVGNNLYFSISNSESTIYSYNFQNKKLSIVDYGLPILNGKAHNQTYAYHKLQSDNSIKIIFKLVSGDKNLVVENMIYNNGFTYEDPDGKFIFNIDGVFYELVDEPKIWVRPYPFFSVKYGSDYVIAIDDINNNIFNIKAWNDSGNMSVIASSNGSVLSNTYIVGNKAYLTRINNLTQEFQLVSFDLMCPENLIITQSMIDSGQRYFRAKTVSVSGLINISADQDIVIEAVNSVNITRTSAFVVESGGSVEITMISDCSIN